MRRKVTDEGLPVVLPGMSRVRGLVAVTILVLGLGLGLPLVKPGRASAAPSWVDNGWVNPAGSATYNGWDFGHCTGRYEAGMAHLGIDTWDYPNGGDPVVALGPGKVVRVDTTGWSGFGAVLVEHTAADGARFIAVYAHVSATVALGDSVAAGSKIATVSQWFAVDKAGNRSNNTHLHLGIRPLAPADVATATSVYGSVGCTSGQAVDFKGMTDPLSYLDAHPATVTASYVIARFGSQLAYKPLASPTASWTTLLTNVAKYSVAGDATAIATISPTGTLSVKNGISGAWQQNIATGVTEATV
jgi:murein DD-endopeptidase MepM/ murein hydrolase activator NlpD